MIWILVKKFPAGKKHLRRLDFLGRMISTTRPDNSKVEGLGANVHHRASGAPPLARVRACICVISVSNLLWRRCSGGKHERRIASVEVCASMASSFA
jgi:hypothetical protein